MLLLLFVLRVVSTPAAECRALACLAWRGLGAALGGLFCSASWAGGMGHGAGDC
jgi:hypothetical protein